MRAKKPGFANAILSDFRCSADFWMLMLKGFNTGWATYDVYQNGVWRINDGWVNFYGTWVPATQNFIFMKIIYMMVCGHGILTQDAILI